MSKKKIGILTDSSSDLTDERAQELGVEVIRMPLLINGKEYIENDTISDAQVIDFIQKGASISTSQPLMGQLIEKIESMLEEYDKVLYIPIASGLSGTYNTACSIAKQFDGRLVVVNATTVCAILQYTIESALKMIDQGLSAEEIRDKIEAESDYLAILLPKDLTSLKNGGRVTPAVAAMGNLLKIIPLLKVEKGTIDVFDKVRTLKKAYAKAIEHVATKKDDDNYFFMVIYVEDVQNVAFDLAKQLEEATGKPVRLEKFRSVIFSHTGPGTIGLGYIKKYNI